MTTYRITRFYQCDEAEEFRGPRGLTLEEAQAHCKDPETSSATCAAPENLAITEEYGQWFDGYEEETEGRPQ